MGKISIGGKEFFGSAEFMLDADTVISDQPGDDSSFITDMGVGPLTIRVRGDCTEETDSLSDVRKEIMTVGELSLILDSGWEYKVFRRSFRPVRVAGTKQTGLNGYHNEFDAVFVCEEPYQFSTPTTCRAKAITSNNQEWSAEDMPCDNLLDNWSFEDWSSGASSAPDEWSAPFTGNSASRETDPIFGTYCAEFVNDGSGGDDRLCRTVVSLIAGTEYTVGFWMKSVSGDTTLDIYTNDGVVGSVTITASWAWYSATFTASTTIESNLDIGDATGGAATIRIDGAVMIEGSSITDSTFARSISTDGEVDAVPDIQITGGTTHIGITQEVTNSNYNTNASATPVTITITGGSSLPVDLSSSNTRGQTINCRKAGMAIIDSAQLDVTHVSTGGNIICEIYTGVGGTLLGSKTLNVTSTGIKTFTFSTPIAVVQEEDTCADSTDIKKIYVLFTTAGGADFTIIGYQSSSYTDGNAYINGAVNYAFDHWTTITGHSCKEIQQTFTVPETYKISKVTLNLCKYQYAGSNPVTVTIKEGATTLGAGTATLSGSTFTDVDFYLDEETAHSLELSAGTTYTIVITPPSDSGNATAVLIKTKTTSVYANGAVTLVEDGGTTRAQTHDIYFKLYFAHSNEDIQIYNTADTTTKCDVAKQILEGAIHRINVDGTGTIDFDDDFTTDKYATTNEGMSGITHDTGNDELDIADDGYIYYTVDCKYPVTGIPTLTSQINITAGIPTIQISVDAANWYDIDTAIVDDVDTIYELDDSTNLSLKGQTSFYFKIDCVKAAAATVSIKSFELDVDIVTIDAENPVITEGGSASTFKCTQNSDSGMSLTAVLVYADRRWPG